ncbi:probable DNA metabolism protein [Geosporobacter subterraneus DSM 17957]|uniref:Probable DNA metabolism protein n=1 Tax=Geosporobacter subterraneus DSM 17957 TaxID=1121919 RepID=A0A1M6JUP1_9FIRM|nr:DUF4130 domain-containing protein [Geosporobacter subterraneus]SHJ50403.1 probable DNA metabolism protein [Geosporobacter subterraneus DSM 17957]
MIRYHNNMGSFFKACVVAWLLGDSLCSEEEWNTTLLQFAPATDVAQYSWEEIQHMLRKRNRGQWIFDGRGSRLKHLLLYALRHREDKKYSICKNAIDYGLQHGIEGILYKTTEEGKELYRLYRNVFGEIHAMCGLVRFVPSGKNTLAAKVQLEHDTIDFLMAYFRQRYPDQVLILVSGGIAYICDESDEIYEEEGSPFEEAIKSDDFGQFWEIYYKAQYIQERKNLRLTAKVIRKKYWNWLQEGKLILEEEQKDTRK